VRPTYPWSAVVGQEALKQALLLCAIDPAIGGVLVQGPRGVAKTTLARALGELVSGSFIELPLGASEERVAGSLDLQSALRDGQVAFAPGVLARAHEGVLYVDEVNLLPDGLVDLLLDAAATGFNTVERDAISHTHPARFVLVGTMNPDEGELRPQLTDRFGLSARAEGEISAEQRAEIVQRRLAFDAEPNAFIARFAEAQRELVTRCRAARERLANIPLAGAGVQLVSEWCHREALEGVRADLAMLRAARAHAAWHQRDEITRSDVEAVAELALAHRRRTPEPPRSGPRGGSGSPPGAGSKPPSSGPSRMSGAGGGQPASQASDTSVAGGDAEFTPLAPIPVQPTGALTLPPALLTPRGREQERKTRGRARMPSRRGQRAALASAGPIDWFATLAGNPRPTLRDLRHRGRRVPSAELLVIALDCSSSMLRSGALARAKALVQACERAALRSGTRVALVAFRGNEAELVLDAGESRPTRKRAIEQLAGGGGTPLRSAMQQAFALCRSRRFASDRIGKRILLVTDGRTRETLTGMVRDPDWSLAVVDCERGPARIGGSQRLASSLGAALLVLDGSAESSRHGAQL
jgi:magnesium chelatase subunit D